MEYTLQINDREYGLPKKTLAVEEKIEKIKRLSKDTRTAARVKYENKVNFICEMVGSDNAKEIVDTDDLAKISEMDLGDIDVAVRNIIDGYERPTREQRVRESMEILGNPMIAQMLSVAEGMDKLQTALDKTND